MDYVSDNSLYKAIWFFILIAFISSLFFAFKVDACSSHHSCHDSFIPAEDRLVTCMPGAVGQLVKEPKVGMLCHCITNASDAGP